MSQIRLPTYSFFLPFFCACLPIFGKLKDTFFDKLEACDHAGNRRGRISGGRRKVGDGVDRRRRPEQAVHQRMVGFELVPAGIRLFPSDVVRKSCLNS